MLNYVNLTLNGGVLWDLGTILRDYAAMGTGYTASVTHNCLLRLTIPIPLNFYIKRLHAPRTLNYSLSRYFL